MPIIMCIFAIFLSGCINININHFYQLEHKDELNEDVKEDEIEVSPPSVHPPTVITKPQEKPTLPSELPSSIRFQDLVPYLRSHEVFNRGLVEELTPISLEKQLGIRGEEIVDSFVIKSIQSDYYEVAVFQCQPPFVNDVLMKVVAYHLRNTETFPDSVTLKEAKWIVYDEDTIIYVAMGNNDEWINKIQSFV